jgi:hypothetical protein
MLGSKLLEVWYTIGKALVDLCPGNALKICT